MNKVKSGQDGTLGRNAIKHWLWLSSEYNLVKEKNHTKYKFINDFYKANGLKRQNFLKYYNRFQNTKNTTSFLPQKRGPRYKIKRTVPFIENKAIMLRNKGLNRFEIYTELEQKYKKFAPKPSTVYNIFKRNNLNRLKPKMKQNKRRIIKQKAGELGHIDCHYLPKGIIESNSKRYYLVAIVDSCTRIAWIEVVENIRSLTVMFSVLKMFNMIKMEYNIGFSEVLTDNGSEFGSGKLAKNKDTNPFERMLFELGVKHRYTRPYRPQTNGKVERFWKTINDDLLDEVVFDSIEHLKDEVLQYVVYYNEARLHQGIDGQTPANFLKNLSSK